MSATGKYWATDPAALLEALGANIDGLGRNEAERRLITATGFGDITLNGTWGRMLSVAVMIFGVTLFLRLLQVLFRPSKVRQQCEVCGLVLHDTDAVHCKHCGTTIHIKTEGNA